MTPYEISLYGVFPVFLLHTTIIQIRYAAGVDAISKCHATMTSVAVRHCYAMRGRYSFLKECKEENS